MVVIVIITLLAVIVLVNYRIVKKQFTLQRAAYKLAQDLRRAQEMALSTKEMNGNIPDGYGIHFKKSWDDYYILFADLNDNHHREAGDQDLEIIELEEGTKILDLLPASSFSVLFSPPDPTVWIANLSTGTQAVITLCLEDDITKTKVVEVNNAGLIEVK